MDVMSYEEKERQEHTKYNPYICDRCGKDTTGLAPNDYIEDIDIIYKGMHHTISFKLCRQCSIEIHDDVMKFLGVDSQ